VIEGDITEETVDAIVSAADTGLQGSGGVAAAIRRAAGPSVQEECDGHAPLGLGEALLTGSGQLPARHVVHAASREPGGATREEDLRAAVRRALEIVTEQGLESVAFPAIGTGGGGLSLQRSAEVMLEEAWRCLESETCLQEIRFVLRGELAYRVFEQVDDARRIRVQMEKLRR